MEDETGEDETVTPRKIARMVGIRHSSVGAWIRRARANHGLEDTGQRDPDTGAKTFYTTDIRRVMSQLTGSGDFSKGNDRAPRHTPKQQP